MLKEYTDLFFGSNEHSSENTLNYYYPRAENEVRAAHSTDFKKVETYPSYAEKVKSPAGSHFPSPSFNSVISEEGKSLSNHRNPPPKYPLHAEMKKSPAGTHPSFSSAVLEERKSLSNHPNPSSPSRNKYVVWERQWVDQSHSPMSNFVGTRGSRSLSNRHTLPYVGPEEKPLSNHRNTPTFNNYVVSKERPRVNQIHSQSSNYIVPKENRPLSDPRIPSSLNNHVVPEKMGPLPKRFNIKKENSTDTGKKEKKASSIVPYDQSQDPTYSSNRSPRTVAKNSNKGGSPLDTSALPWYGSQDPIYSSNRRPGTSAKNSDKGDSPLDTLALPWYGN